MPIGRRPSGKACILLKAPLPFSKLIRIRLLVNAEHPPIASGKRMQDLAGIHGGAEEQDTRTTDGQCLRLCAALNKMRPGGLLAALGEEDSSSCLVFCPKANLVGAYKALHAQQASLGFQLKDVKSSVFMTPLTDEALKNPLQQLFTNALKVAGWQSLSDSVLLRCCILEAPMGKVLETCCIEALDTLVESPDRILLLLRLSSVRFRPMIASHGEGTKAEALQPVDVESYKDAPCRVLPSQQLAWVVRVLPQAERAAIACDASMLCSEYLQSGWEASIPLVAIKFWQCETNALFLQDDDAAEVIYPACCVWSVNGLSEMPLRPDTLEAILQKVAGDLEQGAAELWSGQPVKAEKTGFYNPFPACSPTPVWQSAQAIQPNRCIKNPSDSAKPPLSQCIQPLLTRNAEDPEYNFSTTKSHPKPSKLLLQNLNELSLCKQQEIESSNRLVGNQRRGGLQSTPMPKTPQTVKSPQLNESLKLLPISGNDPKPGTPQQKTLQAGPPKAPILKARIKPVIGGVGLARVTSKPAAKAADKKGNAGVRTPKPAAAANPGVKKTAAKNCPAIKQVKSAVNEVLKDQELPNDKNKQSGGSPGGGSNVPLADPLTAGLEQTRLVEEKEGSKDDTGLPRNHSELTEGTIVKAGIEQKIGGCKRKPDPTVGETEKGGNDKAPARKRTKAGDLNVADVTLKVQQKHVEGKIKDLTVPEIKCYLKLHNLPVGGKKEDILTRLTELLSKQPHAQNGALTQHTKAKQSD